MRDGIRIGRLFGVAVVVDFSWVFIFLLMSWNLTVAFGQWHPDWTLPLSLGLAVVAALLFFLSVLAHEFAHALVATSFGIPVREIRLFLFGGVSNIEREPPSAKSEFLMAVVGPIVSIGIGLNLLFAASWFLTNVDPTRGWDAFVSLGPLPTLLLWLGAINLGVGIFNLIPGFPLDGGRILRAALWAAERDLRKATREASTVGQAIGWMFIVAGIAMFFGVGIPLLGRGPVSGLWIAFIGWFLRSASERSYRSLLVQDILEGVKVASLMRRKGYALPPDTTVGAAVHEWFMRAAQHAFPVVDAGRLLGLVSVSDIRNVPQTDWGRAVTAIMTPTERLAVTTPAEGLDSALQKFAQRDVEQMPVLDDGVLVGMLERRDVARWLELRLDPRTLGTPRAA